MSEKNKLFYVRADSVDGDNLDLLVIAADEAQVTAFWQKAYELDDDEVPKKIGIVPGVTPTAEPGPIDWDKILPE